MTNPTLHIEAARRHAANIERLTEPRSVQAHHLLQVITPARTGGKIGLNRRRKPKAAIGMGAALALMAGIAIALAIITALTIQP